MSCAIPPQLSYFFPKQTCVIKQIGWNAQIQSLLFQQPTLHWFINYKMPLQKYFDPIVDARHKIGEREATGWLWSWADRDLGLSRIISKHEQSSKECATLGLAISPESLFFCIYFSTYKYVIELSKEKTRKVQSAECRVKRKNTLRQK